MKRVRCPKCDNYITFDETQYAPGKSLVFQCSACGKEFGIRIGVSKLRNTQKDEVLDEQTNAQKYGSIVVIENVFHYKQVIPLCMGDNIIGRYMKNSGINCPLETRDPSIDIARRTGLYVHFCRQRYLGRSRTTYHHRRNTVYHRCHQHCVTGCREPRRIIENASVIFTFSLLDINFIYFFIFSK